MWLSDFAAAIEDMKSVFGDSCWTKIVASPFGDSFVFTDSSDRTFRYSRSTGAIIETFPDTWRNIDHVNIIRNGK